MREQEEHERQAREARARELAREEEEQRESREQERQQLIDDLTYSSADAQRIADRHAKRQREKGKAERERREQRAAAATLSASFTAAKVAKARAALSTVPDEPHVPLNDNWSAYEDKFVLRESGYFDPMSEAVRKDREGIMRGGGYIVNEAWERALRSAVAGLDIMPLGESGPPAGGSNPLASGDVVMAS